MGMGIYVNVLRYQEKNVKVKKKKKRRNKSSPRLTA